MPMRMARLGNRMGHADLNAGSSAISACSTETVKEGETMNDIHNGMPAAALGPEAWTRLVG